MASPLPSRARAGSSGTGFSIVELLVVLCMAGILMAIGMPALLNVGMHYKIHSSAQQIMMLGRQARYQSIALGQQVSVVPDANRKMFYVISGPPPVAGSFPNGITDFQPISRIAVWEAPIGVTFVAPAMFTFSSDGSGLGGPVTFSSPNQPSSTVTMTSTATGKLVVK